MTMNEPSGAERATLEAKRGLGRAERWYAVDNLEVRAATEPDSTIVNFYGHASVTNRSYEMYGGPDKGGWNETIDRGAFKKTLGEHPDVKFLLNHGGLPLARTTDANNLHLSEDSIGLAVVAELDTEISLARDIAILMEKRVLNEMSFAFRINRQKWLDSRGDEVAWWDEAGVDRHITEVDLQKGDVSVVTYGANPYTDAAIRSLSDVMRELTANRETIDAGEMRAAAEYLMALADERAPVDWSHEFVDSTGNDRCDICGMSGEWHAANMASANLDPEYVALLLEEEHRAFRRRHAA